MKQEDIEALDRVLESKDLVERIRFLEDRVMCLEDMLRVNSPALELRRVTEDL